MPKIGGRAARAAERHWRGVVASEGLAAGTVFLLTPQERTADVAATTPHKERRRLKRAMEAARRDIARLIAKTPEPESAHILDIQLRILEDKTLIGPVHAAIAAGASAAQAWNATVAVDDAVDAPADAPYLTARDSDTRDVRDRVARLLLGRRPAVPPLGAILVAEDIGPTRFLEIDWSHGGGLALTGGSRSSHVAMLARAKGVPMLVGLAGGAGLVDGAPALLDAERGELVLDAPAAERAAFERRAIAFSERTGQVALYLPGPAVTAEGERVWVGINVAGPTDLDGLEPSHCDGVGLVRTEFLFQGAGRPPNERRQFEAYERIIQWAAGRPVTFRTLDGGGDKPIAGLSPENEPDPFLGWRGVRLSLRHPAVFRVQLRALLRAAALGPVRVMLPMVTSPDEVAAVRDLLDKVRRDLKTHRIGFGKVALGIMVEVPAAALAIEDFDADFYSIGSNDLIQYTLAVSRGARDLEALARPDHPAVLGLIERVVAHGLKTGCEVGLCGDMGGDPRYLDRLFDLGLRSLSVAPAALARVKAAIARIGRPQP
ncbi:phosphoenolpyruvate--protein phosphotransferase [Shumkonia mesophila]|uniref:phosphoenolpyruvate--protein phosphotransferase n=1 Tax=Shumkonia mesophila TaxID=2838854 RepID=UPI002934B8DE|nr:phosphoenolpyruvate--protein phosphotransferase [Shumkonia mesophila]